MSKLGHNYNKQGYGLDRRQLPHPHLIMPLDVSVSNKPLVCSAVTLFN